MQDTWTAVFQVAGSAIGQGDAVLEQSPNTLPIVNDARWSDAFTGNSWGALAAWVILMVVLQAAMWPLVHRLFTRFPDRGWGFGRLLTLLVAGYLVWLPASLEWITFRAVWCGVAVAATAVGAFALGRLLDRAPGARPPGGAWFRNGSIVVSEGVFWAVFGLFLLYRLINHDSYHPIWGGEKPMEFAHINAILRSPHFPPIDPWYAGGTLNYYYYGAYLVAFMMKLTGIPSEIAFNLAQPTMMAFLAVATCTLVMGIGRRLFREQWPVRLTGAIGVILMVISGNLVVAARLVTSFRDVVPPWSDFGYWFWDPSRIVPGTIDEFPYFTGTYADLHAHGIALPMTIVFMGLCWNLADHARQFALAALRPGRHRPDLLAALLQMGLMSLVFGTIYMTNAWDVPTYAAFLAISLVLISRQIPGLVRRLAVIAVSGGAIAAITYLMVTPFRSHYVSLYGQVERVPTVSPPIAVYAHFGLFFLIVTFGLAGIIARLMPRPVLVFHPVVLGSGLTIALLARLYAVDRSTTWIVITDGLLVLVPVVFLMFGLLAAMPDRLDGRIPGFVGRIAVVAAWLAVVLALANEKTVFAMFLGLGSVAAIIWLMRIDAGTRFVGGLIAGGMYVGAALEMYYVFDGMTGDWFRMNTVFKFYMAVWAMLAVSSAWLVGTFIRGILVPDLDGHVRPADESSAPDYGSRPDPVSGFNDTTQGWALLGAAVAVLAIAASLAFPVFSTSARLNQQFADPGRTTTLNALDWMSYGTITGPDGVVYNYAGDRAVIEWFNEHVPGTPVIAEASFDAYRCAGSRISIHTGLPDVIGWEYHDSQQRGAVDLAARAQDVRTLYASTDPATKIAVLDRYGVQYVVVGDLERHYPASRCGGPGEDTSAGAAAFEQLVGTRLEVAFTAGDTVVYRVV